MFPSFNQQFPLPADGTKTQELETFGILGFDNKRRRRHRASIVQFTGIHGSFLDGRHELIT
jgi:hypothetical protein